MGVKVIGVDPHKRSHTAVVLDDDEEIAAQLRVAAYRRQVDRLVSWAKDWPERIWAVENANGLGRLLSQQLVMAGEQVVDVPASLSHRTRKLSGKSARKTDKHDARSVAITAAHPGRLRTVELEDFSRALGLILDRRWHLVTFRHRTICRLHASMTTLTDWEVATQPEATVLGAHDDTRTDRDRLRGNPRPVLTVGVQRVLRDRHRAELHGAGTRCEVQKRAVRPDGSHLVALADEADIDAVQRLVDVIEGESNGAEGRSGFAELGDLDPGQHRHEPADLPLQRAPGLHDALAVSLAARRSLAKGGVHESLV